MKNHNKLILLIFLVSFFFYSESYSQLNDSSKVISLNVQELYSNRTEKESKISSDLFYKLASFLKQTYKGKPEQEIINEFKKDEFSIFDDQNRLLVFVRLSSNSKTDEEQLVNLIKINNGEIYSVGTGHNSLVEITAYLPMQMILKIADNDRTALIKRPSPFFFWSIKSLGDEQLKSKNVREFFNVDGSNIKVGVISDGIDNWFDSYSAGELNNISIIRNGNGNEGTAMLEIIHDIAPNAELIFAGVRGLLYPVNWTFLSGLVHELHYTRGCKIIVDDFYTPEEPFFSDEGEFGDAVRSFINDGGIYISAAGNARNSLYSGITNFVGDYHLFPDGKDYLEFTVQGQLDWLYLQWATDWTNPDADLDFEALNITTNTTYYSNSVQSSSTPPYEMLEVNEPGIYRLKIKKKIIYENLEFKILSVGGNYIPNNDVNQIFGHTAYPKVISVAAYEADSLQNISYYSSQGPAKMYDNYVNTWTIQQVPTITATSSIETFVGSINKKFDSLFVGTSAAAPHIAGLAALYFHKLNGIDGLNKTNIDFYNDLTATATTVGFESSTNKGGVWNKVSGFGRADILAAINRSLQTVATPIITPASGTYSPPQTISITCATEGATIYYTVDGTEPSQTNGTLYTTSFNINTNITIKAKAFKVGYTASAAITEIYTISNQQVVATVMPVSGTYPEPLTVTISWQGDGYECYTTRTFDGTEPPDPANAGNNISRIWYTPYSEIHPYDYLFKLKVQLKKDGQWESVVYVQYDIRPALRIAQIDDEITQGNNSFGEWYKWEDNNHWAAHPDETIVRPTQTSDWFIKASQEFKDPDVFRKYNVWSINQGTNYFVNHAKIPMGSNTSSVLAHFKQTFDVTVTNKLENSFSANQGSFIFKNPWIVDDNSDSKGPRNRGAGTTDIPLLPYSIDFSITPNITTGSIHKGVFLNQPYTGNNPAYYSVKVDEVQSIDPGGTIGTRDFYFLNWSANPSESASFQNADALETPVVFKSDGATVRANLKGHLFTNSLTATASNNQRKIVQGSNGYWAMVYVSMNQVWLSRSTDGVNWEKEIWISEDGFGDINGCPSIDVYNDQAYIVWQSIWWVGISGWNTAYINIRRYNLSDNTLGPTITAASFEPPTESYISTPVIAYPGGKDNEIALAWREPNGIKLIHGDGMLGDDNINWGNIFTIPGTNSYSSNPSIAYASGYNFALSWAQSSSGYKIYYTTATKTYNPEWTFGATELISPSYWEGNINPQITVVDRYNPTIVWTSRNDIVEGRSSVHIRQRSGLSTNDIWGNITSFSPNTSESLSPVIGNYSESTKMEILWTFANYVFKASYNGSTWSSSYIISTSGGNGININKNSAWNTYETKALWKKSDNTIAFQNIGSSPLSKIVASSENQPIKLPYRLNRHAIIELPKDIDSTAKGSISFEIAGISTIYNDTETKIDYSFNENNLLASEPVKVAATGMQLSFSGAIYGSGLELPGKLVITINEPLAKVMLKDSKTNETLQNIWVNNSAMLNQVQNKTFGEFRNVSIDLNKYLGKTVYVQVEMIGKSKNIKPLIVDDYLILNDSTSIAESLAKKNYTDYSLPADYTLMQNFPNPFNPNTTITFFLPEAQHTTLKIYNVLGKEVMTAVNENLAEGYHSVDVNMSNEPSGVYLYSLSAGSFRDTKKLMLLK